MRVAVIGPNWHPLCEPYAGGQESLVATLIAGLRRRGHVVEAYAAAGTPRSLADRVFTYPEAPEFSAAALGDPQLPEPGFLVDQVAFTAAVADLATRDVDIVLNHSLHYLVPALGALSPAPVVTTLHTPPFPWLEVGAALAPAGSRFVAVSSYLARQWTTIPAVDVIPNGVDPARFPVGHGGDDLVWVGRIVPEKGLHVAIAAARQTGRRLHVVGPRADAAYAAACLDARGDAVVHHGHADHHEVADLVGRCAAALVTPRWDEPFGLVAAEAMMCGTPVVALARGGLVDVVGGDGGVLVSDTVDGASEARSATDDVLGARLAAAVDTACGVDRTGVRSAAMLRLSVEAMLDGYDDLMRSVSGAAVVQRGTR